MDVLPKAIARLQTWKLVLIAALAGALSVLAMAPFLLWPIMFLTFPVLIWALDGVYLRGDDLAPLSSFRRRVLRAAAVGWGFGFGYFLLGTYWIGYAFYVDADRYAALMPLAVAGLSAALALFYAAAGALAAALWRPGYARILAFVLAFFCAEAARGYLFTGFPWNLFGEAAAANDAHMQMAAYIGIYGLTLAALFIFSAPAAAIASPRARLGRLWAPILCAALFLTGSYAFGTYRLLDHPGEVEGVRVRIVQPNIRQIDKWKPENRNWIFERVLDLSRSGTSGKEISGFTHVIWPEFICAGSFRLQRRNFQRGCQGPARRAHPTKHEPHYRGRARGRRESGAGSLSFRSCFQQPVRGWRRRKNKFDLRQSSSRSFWGICASPERFNCSWISGVLPPA